MDPQATLIEMLVQLRDGYLQDAQAALADLQQWHKRGASTPDLKAALRVLLEDEKPLRLYSGEDEHGC